MKKKEEEKSALSVSEGVDQPPSTNPDAISKFRQIKRKKLNTDDYVNGIKSRDRVVLGRAITLVESNNPVHYNETQKIIEKCLPITGNSIRIGITGVPGVGKSSFIESFGSYLTNHGHRLAVLAIDPSSERSNGSILGDKTRMEKLSADENAFIRPSPSSGSLGGVARKTRESVILCEAAGFDVILIETVGVGQSETAVHSMVDFFLLLMLAGAGDELQGIKRGIMEMADLIAITKADGSNIEKAHQARIEYANALHLFPSSDSGWIPEVLTCSSRTNAGISVIWNKICEYLQKVKTSGYFENRRKKQSLYWMYETINQQLKDRFYHHKVINDNLEKLKKQVLDGNISSFIAANKLLETYRKLPDH